VTVPERGEKEAGRKEVGTGMCSVATHTGATVCPGKGWKK